MEALKIAVVCVAAAIVYGIIHDQITARICVEYFTIFHPPIFHTQSPTLLGMGWGVVATWWVGAFFAIPLILAARAGSRLPLQASDVLPPIVGLLAAMAAIAALSGIVGYVLASQGVLATDWLSFTDSPATRYRFMADWWAHTASYAAAFVGGIVVCVITYRKRLRPWINEVKEILRQMLVPRFSNPRPRAYHSWPCRDAEIPTGTNLSSFQRFHPSSTCSC